MNTTMKPRLRYVHGEWVISTTPQHVKRWMRGHGITISDWSRQHGFSRYIVNDLLRGKIVGHHGTAHSAAIALGLKLDPSWVKL